MNFIFFSVIKGLGILFCLLLVASATCLFYPSVWVTGADLLLAIVAWLKNTHEQSKLIYFVVLAVTIAILMAFNALYVIKGAKRKTLFIKLK